MVSDNQLGEDAISFLGALPQRPPNAKFLTQEAFAALGWPWDINIRDTRAKKIIDELLEETLIETAKWSTAGWSFSLTDDGAELAGKLSQGEMRT
jgi:hypothetical protein